MDQRGIAEAVGAALVGSALTAVGLWLFAGAVDWLLVVGIGAVVALASAASYRDGTGHADLVEEPRNEPAGGRRVEVDRGVERGGAVDRDIERRTPDREPPRGDDTRAPPTDSDR